MASDVWVGAHRIRLGARSQGSADGITGHCNRPQPRKQPEEAPGATVIVRIHSSTGPIVPGSFARHTSLGSVAGGITTGPVIRFLPATETSVADLETGGDC